MIIGPAMNFLLLNLNVKLGPFVLDKLTGPGVKIKKLKKKSTLIQNIKFSSFKASNGTALAHFGNSSIIFLHQFK